MKKTLIILGMLATTAFLYAALVTSVFSDKTFATSESASPDTSSTIVLHYYHDVNLVTQVEGTDSVKIYIYVDGYYNGHWQNKVVGDTLSNLGATGSKLRTTELRGVTAGIGGYEAIRIRNLVTSYADSSSVLKYNQQIVER